MVAKADLADVLEAVLNLKAQIAAQEQLIRQQADALEHRRKTFEQASAAASIGVWECDLATQALRWSDVVYDLFDLPRGSFIDREGTLAFYVDAARREMEAARAAAIARRDGFSLDVQIVTAKGRRRVIRITATVECENGAPARIFGMKQDITEETALKERMRRLAEFDPMTGLANRSQFQARLDAMAASRSLEHGFGALVLVDLDGFKQVNDTLGHARGDACLTEAADRLRRAARDAALVARIGGDEFAVLLSAADAAVAEELAGRIVREIRTVVVAGGISLPLGASVGVAQGDGTPEELFARADAALYAAKAGGKGAVRVYGAGVTPVAA